MSDEANLKLAGQLAELQASHDRLLKAAETLVHCYDYEHGSMHDAVNSTREAIQQAQKVRT